MTQSPNVNTANQTDQASLDGENERLAQTKLPSLAPECDPLKSAYDACFQDFFQKFLRGSTTDPCGPKLKAYQKCLRSTLVSLGIDLTEVDASRMDSDTLAAMLNKR
ncbi:hypothetical protein P879_05495 [Paragonimus westermani]|uniref:Mitochondrial distribution and morphology protein 35 n=1 Tax=Paragonimus westermani TaxID=34504 RepID=A0A8T0DQ05_9TREM|nr:hypothetical protein P879_05495 [Paragonimus westermani]